MKERLQFAVELMVATNAAHSTEIFSEIELNKEDECISFQIMPDNMPYIFKITELLNLTFSLIQGDHYRTIKYYIG